MRSPKKMVINFYFMKASVLPFYVLGQIVSLLCYKGLFQLVRSALSMQRFLLSV